MDLSQDEAVKSPPIPSTWTSDADKLRQRKEANRIELEMIEKETKANQRAEAVAAAALLQAQEAAASDTQQAQADAEAAILHASRDYDNRKNIAKHESSPERGSRSRSPRKEVGTEERGSGFTSCADADALS